MDLIFTFTDLILVALREIRRRRDEKPRCLRSERPIRQADRFSPAISQQICGVIYPSEINPTANALGLGSHTSPTCRGVAAASTNSHLGLITAVPKELSLGFTKRTRIEIPACFPVALGYGHNPIMVGAQNCAILHRPALEM